MNTEGPAGHRVQCGCASAARLIADGVFVRGRVPEPSRPSAVRLRLDQRRHVLGIKVVPVAAAVTRPQVKILQLDGAGRGRKRARVNRSVLRGQHGIGGAGHERRRRGVALSSAQVERRHEALQQDLLERIVQAVAIEVLRRRHRRTHQEQDNGQAASHALLYQSLAMLEPSPFLITASRQRPLLCRHDSIRYVHRLLAAMLMARTALAADISGNYIAEVTTSPTAEKQYARVDLKVDGTTVSGVWGDRAVTGSLTGRQPDAHDWRDRPVR